MQNCIRKGKWHEGDDFKPMQAHGHGKFSRMDLGETYRVTF